MALTRVNIELSAAEMHSAITQWVADNWPHGDKLRTLLEEHVDLTDLNKFYLGEIPEDSTEFKVVAEFRAHRHG